MMAGMISFDLLSFSNNTLQHNCVVKYLSQILMGICAYLCVCVSALCVCIMCVCECVFACAFLCVRMVWCMCVRERERENSSFI